MSMIDEWTLQWRLRRFQSRCCPELRLDVDDNDSWKRCADLPVDARWRLLSRDGLAPPRTRYSLLLGLGPVRDCDVGEPADLQDCQVCTFRVNARGRHKVASGWLRSRLSAGGWATGGGRGRRLNHGLGGQGSKIQPEYSLSA
jgi:hypothetical protein